MSSIMMNKDKEMIPLGHRVQVCVKRINVTLLKLHLYLQVLLEQVQNHRLHVATYATPEPGSNIHVSMQMYLYH